MEILNRSGLRVIHLIDGNEHNACISLINNNEADGINFNYVKNLPDNINFVSNCPEIKFVQINFGTYDYSIVNTLTNLIEVDILNYDRVAINFEKFPFLKRVRIYWRPKAKSLFTCSQIEELFLGKFRDKELLRLSTLKKLRCFRLNTGSVQSLEGIQNLCSIEELWLMLIPSLKSIDGIQHLPNLKKLVIDDCKNIQDLDVIKYLSKMVTVNLMGSTNRLASTLGITV